MRVASRMHLRTGACMMAAALLIALVTAIVPQGTAYAAESSGQLAAGVPLQTADKSASITPGVYYIQSQLSGEYMLDVDGASKASGANVQIYGFNNTKAQRWSISKASDGTYKLRNVASGKYLDLAGGTVENGNNIQQYKGNGSAAQRWTFKKSGAGYIISPSESSSYAIDVNDAKAANGTNVQLYKKNGSSAQKWWLIPVSPSLTSKKVLKNGVYELRLTSATSYVVDSATDKVVNGANVELNKRDSSISQRWYIHWESDGYYTIRNISTGKALDVEGDDVTVRTNVQTWSLNGTDAQRWAIFKNSDGSYVIRNKASGLAIDVEGAKAANGTNVRMMAYSNGASQRFTIKHCSSILPNNTYVIYSMLSPLKATVEIPDASKKVNVQAKLYTASGNMAERFYLRKVSGNVFTIQSAISGKYLADIDGKVVQKKQSSSKKLRWTVGVNGGGLTFTNVATGKRMAVSGSSVANGTKLVTATAASKNAQRFHLVATRLIPDGYYEVENAASSRLLDVTGGATANETNVQLYKRNKTAAQTWNIAYVDNGYYKIINDGSSKALDVANGSADAKANVWQYAYNKSSAQMWKPILRKDGAITFVNQGSNMALEAAGTKNGSNVRQNAKTSITRQGWYLTETISRSLSGNATLDTFIRSIVDDNDGDLKKCFNWLKSNVTRVDAVSTTVPSTGVIADSTTITQALYVFQNKKADSYYYASALKWLATGCGYSAQARAGQISTATEGPTNHGWTEVESNGETYVCDVDLAISIGGGYTWYMTTYDSAAVHYYK